MSLNESVVEDAALEGFVHLHGFGGQGWARRSVTGSFGEVAEIPDNWRQHSTILTARPPRAVSLYLVSMSAPVSRMVLMTLSRLT